MFNINININDDNFNDIYIYILLSLKNEKPLIYNFEIDYNITTFLKKWNKFYISQNIEGYNYKIDKAEIFLIYYKKTNRVTIYIKEKDMKEYEKKINFFLLKYFKKNNNNNYEIIFINKNSNNELIFEKKSIHLLDLKKRFKIKYFKFLDINPSQEAKMFFNSNENILILSGIPGVGKTRFISSLIYYTYKLYNEKINFYYIKGLDSLYIFLKNYLIKNINKEKIHYIILDDFDYLSNFDRKIYGDSIEKEVISLILSLSDGFIEHKIKFVISSNSKIKNIDHALLRNGRLYKLINFKKIELNKIKNTQNLTKYEKEVVNNLIIQGKKEMIISDIIKEFKTNKRKG